MSNQGFKIPVFEYEKGWGSKLDDWMVCLTEEDCHAFKKEFNSKNNEPITPDWYMIVQGNPVQLQLNAVEYSALLSNKRVWLSAFTRITSIIGV